jgi:aldehyde dehydrogenase (NAD+)
MKNLKNFYIDGKWVKPNSQITFPVLNPATEAQIGTIILGNTADVDLAVVAANNALSTAT